MPNSPVSTLANPLMRNIGPAGLRRPERAPGKQNDEGWPIVSADSHWEVTEDIFYEEFPARLKDQAPRVWFDRYWRMGYRGQMEALGTGSRVERTLERGVALGAWDADVRQEHLRAEGVTKEIVFPQSLLGFVRYPSLEIQEHIYSIYNRYISECSKRSTGVTYGVGILKNWWDSSKIEDAAQEIVDLGLKTFMIPLNPGKNLEGENISYGGASMDRFWDVIAAAGLPVNFHIGENPDTEHRGGMGATVLMLLDPFRKPLGQLIFGGVFDRNPNLKIVFSEGGISWIAPALQDAEMIYDSFGSGDLLDPIKERPTYYWLKNCYATFQNDLIGLGQLDYIGADRVMWGADYPHSEGSYGFGWSSRESILKSATQDDARKILGETATALYGLD